MKVYDAWCITSDKIEKYDNVYKIRCDSVKHNVYVCFNNDEIKPRERRISVEMH